MTASVVVPVFGLIQGRILAMVNPLAELDFDLGADDQLD